MTDEKPNRGWWIVFIVWMGGGVVEGVRVALGHTDDLRNFWLQWLLVFGCLLLATLYTKWRGKESYKPYFLIAEMLFAFALTFYQLKKLGELGWQHKDDVVDRLTFLLGSLALTLKSIKNIADQEK
jgi:hypothetical protein